MSGQLAGVFVGVGGDEVIWDYGARPLEPEGGHLRQDLAFVWDTRSEDVVKGGNAVCGNDEQPVADLVEIANLAPSIGRPAVER